MLNMNKILKVEFCTITTTKEMCMFNPIQSKLFLLFKSPGTV